VNKLTVESIKLTGKEQEGTPSFEEWLRDSARAEKTVKSYLSDFRGFAQWFEIENNTTFEPRLVTSWDLRGYYRWSRNVARVAASTWNRRRAMLAVFAEYLQVHELVTYNIFQDIPLAEETELAPRSLERKEYGQFMRQVETRICGSRTTSQRMNAQRDAAMVALMVYCGLRVEEVVNLNHGDIVITERKGVVIIHSGKGDKSGRVPLAGEARRWVSEYLTLRGDESGALFTVSTRQVERTVKEIGRQAGVKVTPHMLRHTCATRMVQNGQPLTVVQKVLRHSRLDVTARYTKPSWEDLEKAVGSL